MLKVVTGNLLNETKGILVHGVNCRGRMGAGIALELRKKYPQIYQSYMYKGHGYSWSPKYLLGFVDFVPITDELVIANAFTQEEYGTDSRRFVSYDAIDHCFASINQYALKTGLPVKYPKIGAGLAGGCWDIISAIIEANRSEGVDHTLFIQ